MASDLTSKARRAAEWFNATQDKTRDTYETADLESDGWSVYTFYRYGKTAHDNSCRYDGMPDRMLIAFCENLGWQDQDQEADGLYGVIARPSYGGSFVDGGLKHHTFAAKGRALTLVEATDGIEFYTFTGDGADRTYKEGRVTSNDMLADLVRWLEYGGQEAELVIPTEEEALDLCARGMAQFMDEIDPDPIQLDADEPSDAAYIELARHCESEGMIGAEESEAMLSNIRSGNPTDEADGVEWHVGSEFARLSGLTAWVHRDNDTWYWEVNDDAKERTRDSGGCLTSAEARAAAVEAARGMNNENV